MHLRKAVFHHFALRNPTGAPVPMQSLLTIDDDEIMSTARSLDNAMQGVWDTPNFPFDCINAASEISRFADYVYDGWTNESSGDYSPVREFRHQRQPRKVSEGDQVQNTQVSRTK